MRTLALALALLAAAAGAGLAADETCLRLFRNYDRAFDGFQNSPRSGVELALPGQVERAGHALRGNGCVTRGLDVIRLDALVETYAATPPRESGAPIRPIALQAGIVAGISSELESRLFFGRLGYRVRSQGAPGVGRRIYLGPFATQGGLAQAAEIAEAAGFVAPYPRRF